MDAFTMAAGIEDTEHPGILYFYSESIALASNGKCACIAALVNFGRLNRGTSTGLWFLIIGGAIQLLCEYILRLRSIFVCIRDTLIPLLFIPLSSY